MLESRTKNAARNIIWGIISRGVTIILPFISRTVVLYLMGTTYLGIGTLFTSILSFLSLAELGLSSAIVFNMYKPIAENDHLMVCALLKYYKNLYRRIGFIILCVLSSAIVLVDATLKPLITWYSKCPFLTRLITKTSPATKAL